MNPESPSPSLPIEVWGQIFKNIDNPLDLMRFRRVCKKWNEEINRVLPFANWKKLCFGEIGEFSLSSIVAVVQPTLPKANYQEIEDQNFWQHVYLHYKKWLRIRELPITIVSSVNDLLSDSSEYITCFDISGVWAIYGTDTGKIYVMHDYGHNHRLRGVDLGDRIDQIKIWHDGNDQFLFMAVTLDGITHFSYSHLIDRGNLNVTQWETSHTLRGDKVCIGTANNLYLVRDDILIRFSLTTPPVVGEISLNFHPDEYVVAISSRESKIFLTVARADTQLRLYTVEDELLTGREQNPMFRVLPFVELPSLPGVSWHGDVYVTLNSIIICTIEEKMYLHDPDKNSWVTYNQSDFFSGKVTSCIVHGNYLIIGSAIESLSVFYVEGITHLLRRDFLQRPPVIMRRLDKWPIIAIKVTDVHGDIHITAFSQMKMFDLKF